MFKANAKPELCSCQTLPARLVILNVPLSLVQPPPVDKNTGGGR